MKRYLILVNPSSGGGRSLSLWARFARRLPNSESVILHSIEEASERAEEAAEKGTADAVIALGGDGTIHAVANGLLRSSRGGGSDGNGASLLPLGVLYGGTSPDFCRFHGIPLDPEAALEVILAGHAERVEVLQIEHNGKIRRVLCSCNFGMGADVAQQANTLRRFCGDRTGTLLALIRNLLKSPEYDYMLNGRPLKHCNHLLITRMPYIAGGLKIALPPLKEEEYLLWHLRNHSFLNWLGLLGKFYRGAPCGESAVCSGMLEIDTLPPGADGGKIEYDGDPRGTLPARISPSERKLLLLKPGTNERQS